MRGWGNYFATGNAASKFNQVDSYVWMRLRKLVRIRKGRQLRAGEMARWTRHAFHEIGLHKLLGTKYDQGVRDLLRYYRENFPSLIGR